MRAQVNWLLTNFNTSMYIHVDSALAVGANHPNQQAANHGQATFETYAMAVTNNIEVNGVPGLKHGIGSVDNPGDNTITGVSTQVSKEVAEWLASNSVTLRACTIPDTIRPFSRVSLECDFVVNASFFSGTFPLRVHSAEANSVEVVVKIAVKELRPLLVVEPTRLEKSVLRGTQVQLRMTISNDGAAPFESGKIHVSEHPYVSLLEDTATAIRIGQGERRDIVLMVTVPLNATLGAAITGTLTMAGLGGFVKVPWRITVTSDLEGDLTVFPENELTYFADGQPYVDGAIVTVTSHDRTARYKQIYHSNMSAVVFRNLTEAFYIVHVQAAGHSSYTETALLPAEGLEIRAFLQKEFVSYTFSVREVAVKETYTFTVAATFATNVPAPVLTVDPMLLDFNELESDMAYNGGRTTIDFAVTNHGLIKASSFFFDFDVGCKRFNWTRPIGEIPANTTVIITVGVLDTNYADETKSESPARNRRNALTGAGSEAPEPVGKFWYQYMGGERESSTKAIWYTGGDPSCRTKDGSGSDSEFGVGNGPPQCDPATDADGCRGGSGSSRIALPSVESTAFCDPCAKMIIDCYDRISGTLPVFPDCPHCLSEYSAQLAAGQSPVGLIVGWIQCTTACSDGKEVDSILTETNLEGLVCAINVNKFCHVKMPVAAPGGIDRRARTQLSSAPLSTWMMKRPTRSRRDDDEFLDLLWGKISNVFEATTTRVSKLGECLKESDLVQTNTPPPESEFIPDANLNGCVSTAASLRESIASCVGSDRQCIVSLGLTEDGEISGCLNIGHDDPIFDRRVDVGPFSLTAQVFRTGTFGVRLITKRIDGMPDNRGGHHQVPRIGSSSECQSRNKLQHSRHWETMGQNTQAYWTESPFPQNWRHSTFRAIFSRGYGAALRACRGQNRS